MTVVGILVEFVLLRRGRARLREVVFVVLYIKNTSYTVIGVASVNRRLYEAFLGS
jgi:hypothetical protein